MKTQWFKAVIYRTPTRYSQPEVVAIEANDRNHAIQRLRKLYGETHAAGTGGGLDKTLDESPCKDSDDIVTARQFPLPTTL